MISLFTRRLRLRFKFMVFQATSKFGRITRLWRFFRFVRSHPRLNVPVTNLYSYDLICLPRFISVILRVMKCLNVLARVEGCYLVVRNQVLWFDASQAGKARKFAILDIVGGSLFRSDFLLVSLRIWLNLWCFRSTILWSNVFTR